MKDSRLWNMKQRAERDRKLSHPAARLLAILISEQYCDRHFLADDEFPLPWSTVRGWINLGETQCYAYLRELEQSGYLHPVGVRMCPPTKFYKFAFTAKDSNSPEFRGIDSPEKRRIISSEKRANHISIPFGKNNGLKGGATAPGTIESTKARRPLTDEQIRAQGDKLVRQMRAAIEERN